MKNALSSSRKLLSVAEAAQYLNLRPAIVRRYCQTGRIRATKVGRSWTIDRTYLSSFALRKAVVGRTSATDHSEAKVFPALESTRAQPSANAPAMISLIAGGLLMVRAGLSADPKSYEPLAPGVPPPPLPTSLLIGWNYLCAAFVLAGRADEQPVGLDELYRWCSRPLAEWPLDTRFSQLLDPEARLINPAWIFTETLGLTAFCEEWARVGTNVRAEIDEERIVPSLRELCRASGTRGQGTYVRLRRFFIENPVVSHQKLQALCAYVDVTRKMCDLLVGANGAYAPIPVGLSRAGLFYACPYCGELLAAGDGDAPAGSRDCVNASCRGRRSRGALIVSVPAYRVIDGIRRFVMVPGLAELELERRLSRLNLRLELWPSFDAYDLLVEFPDSGPRWAVDLKNWHDPTALALRLNAWEGALFAGVPRWDQAFIVFPDELRQRHYLDRFEAMCAVRLQAEAKPVRAMFMREFVDKCRKQLDRIKTQPGTSH